MSNHPNDPRSLKWAESYAKLLDSKFELPGTKFRFGLDPIIGLIPGLGDGAALIMQLLLAFSLISRGVSGELVARLLLNVLLVPLIGSIPVLGWIFDFFFKANQRNLELTKAYLREGKYQGSGAWLWFLLILMVLITLAAIIALFIWLINLLIGILG